VNNMVVQGDTARSIAGILNNAYAAQYGVYFTDKRLIEFNGGEPKVGSYYSFSIGLGDKFAMNGSGYSGGGGYYVGGETNSSAGSVGGGSTPNYYNNAANSVMLSNGRQDITNSLMSFMRTNAQNYACISFSPCFAYKMASSKYWDIKNTQNGPYNSKNNEAGFIFQGKWIPLDAPGNINYGYVGSAAVWSVIPNILNKEAGAAQIAAGNSMPEWNVAPYYGDDPVYTMYIQKGIELYNQ
jgi:hypothetical protein